MTSHSAELPSQPESLLAEDAQSGGRLDAALELDRCLEELSQLAQTEISPRDFYAALVDRAIRVLAAAGGAAWQFPASGSKTLLAQIRFPRVLLNREPPIGRGQGSPGANEPVVLPPFSRASSRYPCDNPHPWPLAVASLAADTHSRVVLEVALDPDAAPAGQHSAARILGVIREIAADYERRRELARLRERDARATQFVEIIMRLHAGLDLAQTAYAIANDGRHWIGCDRVSVLRVKGVKAVTLAVSAVDHVDRGSGQIMALEQFAAAVARSGDSLIWHESSTEELAPQLGAVLQDYLDRGHARQLVALPIHPPHGQSEAASHAPVAPRAVLVAESFVAEQPLTALVERSRQLTSASASAFENAFTHQSLPLLPLQKRIATAARTIARRPVAALLSVSVATLLVTALVVVPADFQVEAEGQLQPAARRNLFAPGDAVVDEVRVVHGAEVRQGDVLLRMHSPALDLEQSRLSGELQTAQARLVAVRAARSRPQDSADADEQQLASEEEQLVEQIAGLTKQLSVVEQMRKELVVTSPLAGIVLTWNTHESLDARPVKQGQLLLTVADPSGPWHVEIEVPDADAGHVIDAQRGSATPLPVSFLLASDPAVTHHGALERLAQATDTKSGNSAAQGIAVVDGKLPASARAGGRVTARIHCGRQSLGYVWLHDLIDFVRTSIWL